MASPRRRRLIREIKLARQRGEAHPADPYAESLGLVEAPAEEPVAVPVEPEPVKTVKSSLRRKK